MLSKLMLQEIFAKKVWLKGRSNCGQGMAARVTYGDEQVDDAIAYVLYGQGDEFWN